ncbi:hypothetical protein LINPERHAP1_LOCUS119 [Linum perenne]
MTMKLFITVHLR